MAKTLYLVRHAESDWNTDGADFDRPLNKRGRRDAPEMGQRIRKRNANPEIVVCSPAERARQTLELLELGTKTVYEERIYEASAEALLEIVRSLDDQYQSVMIVGHNPSMTWLTNLLTGSHIQNMPTTSIATVGLQSIQWAEAAPGAATLLDFDFPKNTPA
jgi:phosphohistidine phosphatase